MVEPVERIHQNTLVNSERKWLRIQEAGLSQFFAMPFAVLLLGMIGLGTFGYIILTLFALGSSGYCCFRIGHEGRVRAQKEIAQNTHNEQ